MNKIKILSMEKISLFVIMFSFACAAIGQVKSTPVSSTGITKPVTPPAPIGVTLSEADSLKVENAVLKVNLATVAVNQAQTSLDTTREQAIALIKNLELKYGATFDQSTGKFMKAVAPVSPPVK